MNGAAKLARWRPLHENPASRWVHFVGGYLFVFAVLVPSFAAHVELGVVPVSRALLEKKTHGLELGGPQLFLTEPAYVIADSLLRAGHRAALRGDDSAPP